jgi:hypothetical protein
LFRSTACEPLTQYLPYNRELTKQVLSEQWKWCPARKSSVKHKTQGAECGVLRSSL